jgi:hypothetical protein
MQHYIKILNKPSIKLSFIQTELNIQQISGEMKQIDESLMKN